MAQMGRTDEVQTALALKGKTGVHRLAIVDREMFLDFHVYPDASAVLVERYDKYDHPRGRDVMTIDAARHYYRNLVIIGVYQPTISRTVILPE